MVVQHNLEAQCTYMTFGKVNKAKGKNAEKLSSGYRINRSSDDAAGLSISEKMRSQIRGLDKASDNAQNGLSLLQTADGALSEVHAVLQRAKELSVQAANDTNTDEDRMAIQEEVDSILSEIDRISEQTEFNTMTLLNGRFEQNDAFMSVNDFATTQTGEGASFNWNRIEY